MPAAVHALAKEPAHSCEAGTNLSAMTVEFMLAVVTQSGLSRTDGTEVFDVGATGDEYAQEFKIDELFHFAITPSTVGNTRHLGISATTGPYTVWDKLDELGIEATHDQVAEIHRQCKAVAAARQAQLPDSVVAGIARTVTGQEGTAG